MKATKKHECIRILRVNLTNEQRLEFGKQLAEVHNNLTQINSDFDRVKAEFKSKISAEESKVVDLAGKVSSGYVMQDVKCRWEMDQPKAGWKRLVRLDIEPHPEIEVFEMTDADKQADLPLEEKQSATIGNDGVVHTPGDAGKKS